MNSQSRRNEPSADARIKRHIFESAARAASLVIAFLFLIAGPARSEPYLWVDPEASLSRFEAVFVNSVSNDTGTPFEFDVTDILRNHLISSLRERGFAVVDSPVKGKRSLTLQGQVTLYTAGSAIARWLVPGLGATQAVLRATFIETDTGEIIADMVVGGYVGAGGLFSIGADKRILEKLASDVAAALRRRSDAGKSRL